jgi:hypothetical protein
MGFFDNLKKAFGLESNTDDELEVEGIDATVTPLRQRNQQSADRVATPSAGDSDADYRQATASVAAPSAIPTDKLSQPDPSVIFEQVIEVFNRALPDFLGQSVDPERERQALFKALDSSMKEYFENLEKNVERRLQLKYEVDRQRLHEQIEELQVKARKEEEGTSNAKNLQLSAERQKRALSERVHDLEKQVATLEAENEQYILENKSMANKLRMASMSDREVDEMRQAAAEQAEAARQKEQAAEKLLAEAKAKLAEAEAHPAGNSAEVEALVAKAAEADQKVAEAEAKLAEMSSKAAEADAKVAEADAKVAAAEKIAAEAEQRAVDAEKQVAAAEELLHDAAQETEASANAARQEATAQAGKVAELQAEIARMQTALEHAKAQDALGRAMVNDLNGKAAEARKLADECTTQIDTLKDELVATKEQLATTGQKLAKAQEDLKVVREVQIQVFQLEEKQKHTDATIRRQKDELMEKDELLRVKDADLLTKNTTLRVKDETIRRLEDQTDSLRKSIENIQYEKSQSESALLSEIERLKSLRGMSTATPTNYANIQVVNGAADVSDADAALAASVANAAPQTAPQSPAPSASQPAATQSAPAATAQPATVNGAAAQPRLPIEEPADNGADLTLDLPDLMLDQPDTVVQKPRRGRPPKQKTEEPAKPAKKAVAEEDSTFATLLDSTDWLVATPPTDAPNKPRRQRKQKVDADDDSFGYKEPARQEPPDNPAQMLLW